MMSKELIRLQKVGSNIIQIFNSGRNCSLFCRTENSGVKINKLFCLDNCISKVCKHRIRRSLFYNFIFGNELITELKVVMYQKRNMIIPEYSSVCIFAEDSNEGGPVRRSGGGLGKIDAANETGFFLKNNQARLERIKRELRAKEDDEDEDDDDDEPPAEPKQKSGAK